MKKPALRTSAGRPNHSPRPRSVESPYVRVGESQALLVSGRFVRDQRLAAEDMVSPDEAARLAGTTRAAINAWIDQGRCIGFPHARGGYRVPVWQFEPLMWDALSRLSAVLGATDGWALLTFLETPLGALQGSTPRAAIERGQVERVLELAVHEG